MIATSTDVLGEIGTAGSSMLSSIAPLLYLIIGIVLAIFIAEMALDISRQKKEDARVEEVLRRSHDLQ